MLEPFDFCRGNADIYHLLKKYAKEMRDNPTEAESVLWQYLKGKNLGIGFKRQCVILDFIADFYCPDINLIIEVDGGYHNTTQQIILDEERTKRLESIGYKIIRFTNEEVLCDIDTTILKLKNIIRK